MPLGSAEGRGVAGGREDDGWRPWLLQTELGDERWGGGEGQGRGRVSEGVSGIGTTRESRPRVQGIVGKQEVAGNAHARATLPLCLLAGGRRRLCPRWAGLHSWAGNSSGLRR